MENDIAQYRTVIALLISELGRRKGDSGIKMYKKIQGNKNVKLITEEWETEETVIVKRPIYSFFSLNFGYK